ncbi:MAG TPA: holo-ACP synthase [Gammaproteobacteria bacterium]|nr:holo-ACP synthase [Gammaproteobacteria bacterium]
MNIHGIGADIVEIRRMTRNLERFGERFAQRILADSELAGFARTPRKAAYLARRFAAKEATAKALGTGFRDGLSLRHIAVGHDAAGRPILEFSGRARELLVERGIADSFISLADERENALAFVTLVTTSGG